MRERERLWATGIIWIALVVVIIAVLITVAVAGLNPSWESTVPLASVIMLLIGMAGYSTSRIWQGTKPDFSERADEQTDKAKRHERDRVERLVEQLDEDEIVELETLLLARSDDKAYPQQGGSAPSRE